jgi:prepilin-type N-terminal cleavage/methylation domain-containing protein
MKRRAFTMLELIFVIIIIGILAALSLPRLERDLRQEAIDTVLSAVRYTQHLALADNKHRYGQRNWQKAFWVIRFQRQGGNYYFIIGSNADYGNNIDRNEAAIDPANGKLFYSADAVLDANESPNIFLTDKYGINNIDFSNCTQTAAGVNNARHIAFDFMGRPHKGIFNGLGGAVGGGGGGAAANYNEYATVMTADCEIDFTFTDGSDFTLHIERETGYAYVVGQEDL